MLAEHDGKQIVVMVDVDFMLSGYGCAWGVGCKGIHGDAIHGCCAIGANVLEEEVEEIEQYTEMLAPDVWEHYGVEWLVRRRDTWRDWLPWAEPEYNTALRPDGQACVFSNSPDFPTGAGCALHHAAIRRGDSPVGTRPYICWSIPLRLSWDEENELFWLRGYGMADWGDDGTTDWWCLEPHAVDVESIAWAHTEPLFQRSDEELCAMFSAEEIPGVYEEWIKPLLQGMWDRKPQVKEGVVPVIIGASD